MEERSIRGWRGAVTLFSNFFVPCEECNKSFNTEFTEPRRGHREEASWVLLKALATPRLFGKEKLCGLGVEVFFWSRPPAALYYYTFPRGKCGLPQERNKRNNRPDRSPSIQFSIHLE